MLGDAPDGERTFVTSPGVESQIGRRKLASLTLRPSDAVFVSGYDLSYPELGREIAGWARLSAPDVLLVVDPGPLAAEIPADILEAVYSPGETRHFVYGKGEYKIHDLENVGEGVCLTFRADGNLEFARDH